MRPICNKQKMLPVTAWFRTRTIQIASSTLYQLNYAVRSDGIYETYIEYRKHARLYQPNIEHIYLSWVQNRVVA